jgi:hypothetical protein
LHGIGDPRDDNGDRCRGLFGCLGCRGIHCQDDVNLEPQEFVGQRTQPLVLPRGVPHLDGGVLPFDVPTLVEPLPKGFEQPRGRTVVQEHTNAVSLPRPLLVSEQRCGA